MIGETVSHYKILKKLGSGGMGVVYKAEDTRLRRTVALKFLTSEFTRDPESRERFIHEAQAASALQHNTICTVYDIDQTDEGQVFIVMEYCTGETLKRKIESSAGGLRVDDALEIAGQVAEGLGRAHEAGIVHRDVKPANIMVTDRGEAKILDFGLAKLAGRTRLTRTGTTVGTAHYMSPEQARGQDPDSRSDLWSLGIVLYEMLTGKPPFASDYDQAAIYAILNEQPEPPSKRRAQLPAGIDEIVLKLLQKKPEQRYQSAGEVNSALREISRARFTAPLQERPVRVHRKAGAGIAVAAAVVCIAAALLFLPHGGQKTTSLAVLPFVNATNDPQIEYLCDGLAEALTDQLSRLPEFRKVIAFNGVLQFKGKQISPQEVGKQLGVDALLMTRLHKQGEKLTLNMELVDARENSHIWSGRYDESVDQINSIPQSVFLSLASDLHWGSPGVRAEQARPTTANSEAYRLYLLGRHYYHKLHAEDFRQAARYFQESAEIDPTFALAFTGIAEMYVQRSSVDFPWIQVRDSAYRAANRALELDSQLAQAYGVLGLIQLIDYDLKGGEQSLLKALALNSSYSEGYHYYGHILVYRRTFDRGIAMMQRALELEPLSAFNQSCLANSYEEAGRLDEAVIAYERVREMDSTMGSHCYSGLCRVAIDRGEFDKALDYAKRAAAYHDYPAWMMEWNLANIRAAEGRRTEALRDLRLLQDSLRPGQTAVVPDPMYTAMIYARLGDKEEALKCIEKGYAQRSDTFLLLNVTREFDILRDDPRFIEFLHKGGFVE